MPLYEYLCSACGHRFERIQKFSDALLTECPSCGGRVEKLVSSPAIQFKGSGWYITDYAKSSAKTEGATAPTGDKPTDDKPAADKQAADKPAASTESGDSKGKSAPAAPAATPAKTNP
jgi:putative FmdB family regulatory protein